MALTYDECKALKDAGFGQPTDCVYGEYSGKMITLSRERAEAEGYHPHELTACPNTDEVLDAIAARWPYYRTDLRQRTGPGDVQRGWLALTDSATGPDYVGKGHSPVSAVAALYCALAKEAQHGRR